MRILLIGAFPFPYPQGSQVFTVEQARALARSGAQVALATYGRGEGPLPEGVTDDDSGEVLWIPSSRRFAPRRTRSGPSLNKPVADAALVATVVQAQRKRRFDIALAHNAEAAWVAQVARRVTGLPHVYVAHTLLAQELSAFGRPQHGVALQAIGAKIDRHVARYADATLALSHAGERALQPWVRGPLRRIPPGLERSTPPSHVERQRACQRLGVTPRGFFLYAGNLDGYQDLALLDAAASQVGPAGLPVLVATHDATGADRFDALRVVPCDFWTTRCLALEARALLLPRRRVGGFPIKLLNYLDTGRPVIAHETVAEGLVDGVSARLLPRTAGAEDWADALRGLASQPQTGDRLGAAGREHLESVHDWRAIADQTVALCADTMSRG